MNNPAMIHGHYKGLATKAEAANWVVGLPAHTARAGLRAIMALAGKTLA